MTFPSWEARSAGPGITERDAPATENEERDVASELN